jgi:transposase-like protein
LYASAWRQAQPYTRMNTHHTGSWGEEGYMHETVNHSQGEYARGDIHINHDEAIVSLFKPWLAKHRGVNKRNIPLYAATFQTLYNMRDLSNRDKFWNIIGTCLSNNIQQ